MINKFSMVSTYINWPPTGEMVHLQAVQIQLLMLCSVKTFIGRPPLHGDRR